MRLLVTGASGLLGQKVAELALAKAHEVYTVYNEHPTSLGSPVKLDLTDSKKIMNVINELKPEAIIHAAAYTDVDGCETNRNLAWRVNAEATRNVAMASARVNSHLVHVSTDYVFDGKKGKYSEEDQTNPLSYYGITKLKGEEAVKEHAGEWCIARPSVLYGWGSKHKSNFATWLITNLEQGKEVQVLTDQYVSPTLNTNLAQMLLEIAEGKITGILHTSGATRVNRHEFSLMLAESFNLNQDLIKQTQMEKIPWKAKRPRDSSLDVSKAVALLNQKPLLLNRAFEVMKKER